MIRYWEHTRETDVTINNVVMMRRTALGQCQCTDMCTTGMSYEMNSIWISVHSCDVVFAPIDALSYSVVRLRFLSLETSKKRRKKTYWDAWANASPSGHVSYEGMTTVISLDWRLVPRILYMVRFPVPVFHILTVFSGDVLNEWLRTPSTSVYENHDWTVSRSWWIHVTTFLRRSVRFRSHISKWNKVRHKTW